MSDFKILDQIVHPKYDELLTIIGIKDEKVTVSDGEHSPFIVNIENILKTGSIRKKSKYDLLKMYVVLDNSAPKGLASNGASHVSYFAGESFTELPLQKIWREKSMRNVTCTGSSADIQTAILLAKTNNIEYITFEEPDWTEARGRPLAVAFAARYSFPELFNTFPLFLRDVR